MNLKKVSQLVGGKVIAGEEFLNREIKAAYGADLLSDVLAFTESGTLLLTGLVNSQVVRTAEMLDLCGIVVVRGKEVEGDTLKLAKECNMTIIVTDKTMFESCGILFHHGVKPCGFTK
ncbi:DRTGG domain-containing protein [Proteinivorax hydrogeniformans]|uniref:DRTGG domain-containing protein n=1 Tax=Proteinivorax hydrogeniformans TaxID=1826727 RepID=A0AAU8HWK6_9FIRM